MPKNIYPAVKFLIINTNSEQEFHYLHNLIFNNFTVFHDFKLRDFLFQNSVLSTISRQYFVKITARRYSNSSPPENIYLNNVSNSYPEHNDYLTKIIEFKSIDYTEQEFYLDYLHSISVPPETIVYFEIFYTN